MILALHRALRCPHVAGHLLTRRRVSLQAKCAPVVASADVRQAAGKLGAALALAAVVSFGAADLAEAKTVQPYAGLTPCAGNKAFEKREKNEIKGLTKRLKQVRERTTHTQRACALAVHSARCRPPGSLLLGSDTRGRRTDASKGACGAHCNDATGTKGKDLQGPRCVLCEPRSGRGCCRRPPVAGDTPAAVGRRRSSVAAWRVAGEATCFNPIAVICTPLRRPGARTAVLPRSHHARHVGASHQRVSSADGALQARPRLQLPGPARTLLPTTKACFLGPD